METTNKIKMLIGFLCLSLVIFLSLPGYAGQSKQDVREKWIGRNLDSLINVHGYPEKSFKAPNGNKVYVFLKKMKKVKYVPILHQPQETEIDLYNTKTGEYSYGHVKSRGGWKYEQHISRSQCKGYFEVNSKKRIVNVNFKGGDCPK